MTALSVGFGLLLLFAIGYYVKTELDYAREAERKLDELTRKQAAAREAQTKVMAEKRSVEDAAKRLDDGSF